MSESLSARRIDARVSAEPSREASLRAAPVRVAPRPISRDGHEPRSRAAAERLVSSGATAPGPRLAAPASVSAAQARPRLADPAPTRSALRDYPTLTQRPPPPGSSLIIDGVRATDLVQGAAGTCYFLASLASIAHHRPEWIRDMVRDNRDGTYTVRFFGHNGAPHDVTVDDDLAATSAGPVFARGADPRELWPAIIEKAWAQANGGYADIESSLANFALRRLIGREASMHLTLWNSEDRLFYLIATAEIDRRPMAASTWLGAPSNGLAANHVWTVLGAQVDGGQRYVLLRNPWGSAEFRSDRYDSDVTMHRARNANDGVFRMRLDDFRRYFMAVDIMSDVPAERPVVGEGGPTL